LSATSLVLLGSALIFSSAPALGADTIQVFNSSFNGAGSNPGGTFTGQVDKMAINQVTGSVYVLDKNRSTLNQFTSAGVPLAFTDPSQSGHTAISMGLGGDADIAVDNSGGPNQGNIYVASEGGAVRAFTSTGLELGGNWPLHSVPGQGNFHDNCGLATDSAGNLWVAEFGGEGQGISQFTPAGVYTGVHANVGPGYCHFGFDQEDNLYAANFNGPVDKFDASAGYAKVGQIDPGPTYALALDPVSGLVFVDDETVVNEYSSLGGYASFGTPDPVHSFGGLGNSHGIAVDGSGNAYVSDRSFPARVDIFHATPAPIPAISSESATNVHSNEALLEGTIEPGTAGVTYHFEYGETEAYGNIAPVPNAHTLPGEISQQLTGLSPNTVYHYRLVAENTTGVAHGPDEVFKTYPPTPGGPDSCPNALARKQTGSRALLDCRAYELVSAANTGGYDVESNLAPGQEPFGGYPEASNPPRVLYAVHGGGIPGTGDPTNNGPDPYVATRGSNGWTTSYVGIPASGTPSLAPFASPVAGAGAGLTDLAFGGPNICSPCFSGESGPGVPVRMPNGSLVQGMKGDEAVANPTPAPGSVLKPLSADGTHLVFGSTQKFEPDATGGAVYIYDRDLSAGTVTTHVVSKKPTGGNLEGSGVAELDISSDGSRILIGKLVNEEGGNKYWHLYMNVDDSSQSIDLTSGTTSGALYDGMTSDGTKVFFTTTDKLVPADTDTSADIYEVEVAAAGPVTPVLVSVASGGPSNSEACNPVGTPNSWNAVSGNGKCGAVALAGGAGVAAGDGTFYFLSPELLDSRAEVNGEENQPNLYIVRPGATPKFVATIDSSVGKPPPPPSHARVSGSFVNGLEGPESLAVDQSNGDLYVAERESETVARYNSAGQPDNFTAGPDAGTNELTGQSLGFGGEGEIAVDSAPSSPLKGALYVTSNGGTVSVYAQSGEQLGELTGFSEACGVAVDQSNGAVYVGDYGEDAVWRFEPTSGSTPVSNGNYVKTGITTENVFPCPVGADSSGHAFAIGYGGGPLVEYDASEFEAAAPEVSGTEVNVSPVNRVYTDPTNSDRYVDTGSKIVWLNAADEVLGQFASGEISSSQGVAVNGSSKHVYVSTGSEVIEFELEEVPYEPIDNPTVVHAVHQSATHDTADFQVTLSGDDAVFGSTLPLTGVASNGASEVFRYDAPSDSLDCVSCNPDVQPAGDATLASDGLSITDDGRVFFTTPDQLVLADSNGNRDVYEWEEGAPQLISAGTSPFDSALLTVSADGVDAHFFTHDVLSPQDLNGAVTKIYDARENGGFFIVPPPPPCVASDECHGPGSAAPGPPSIGTIAGTPGNVTQDCAALSAKAEKESRRAKKLRHRAQHASNDQAKKRLRKLANEAAKAARLANDEAKRCRRAG
jgi:sugar lactone lactonase YvrE